VTAAVPDKARVEANFNAAAGGYDAIAVLQRTVAEGLLERLEMMRIHPRRILELGSGTGAAARELARRYRGSRVIQADMALNMLRESRRQTSRWFSRQGYLCADAARLPLQDGIIDLTFSSLMLQWCSDPAAVFAGIRKVMRPGGLILFSSLGPDTLRELRESWREAGDDEAVHVNNFYDMHDVGDALIRAGFVDPVMEVEIMTLAYGEVGELMRELKRLGACNVNTGRRLSLTGKDRMDRMQRAYERRRRDGRLPATYEVVYGHAWVPDSPPQQRMEDGAVGIPLTSIKRRGMQR
jgi:malonyl-CoA O-methyltransferase